uniref:Secreted protein n=1 Tax=Macrostomum lignano TaxID=282301 RepID=A0A1I8F4L5_9PLAT
MLASSHDRLASGSVLAALCRGALGARPAGPVRRGGAANGHDCHRRRRVSWRLRHRETPAEQAGQLVTDNDLHFHL